MIGSEDHKRMMATIVIVALLMSAVFVHGANPIQKGHCNTNTCISQAERILAQPFDCVGVPRQIVEAFSQCMYGCSQSVADPLVQYGRVLEQKMIENGCTDGQAVSCGPADILDCTLRSVELATIYNRIDLADLTKFCVDLQTILDTTQVCSNCLQVLLPGFEQWSDTVSNVVDIVFTMGKGACNCTRDIMGYLNTLNSGSSCVYVTAIVNTAKTVAVDCVGKMINVPLQLDWLTMLNDYLDDYLPYIGKICTWILGSGASSVSTWSSGLSIVTFLLLVFVSRLLWW